MYNWRIPLSTRAFVYHFPPYSTSPVSSVIFQRDNMSAMLPSPSAHIGIPATAHLAGIVPSYWPTIALHWSHVLRLGVMSLPRLQLILALKFAAVDIACGLDARLNGVALSAPTQRHSAPLCVVSDLDVWVYVCVCVFLCSCSCRPGLSSIWFRLHDIQ